MHKWAMGIAGDQKKVEVFLERELKKLNVNDSEPEPQPELAGEMD